MSRPRKPEQVIRDLLYNKSLCDRQSIDSGQWRRIEGLLPESADRKLVKRHINLALSSASRAARAPRISKAELKGCLADLHTKLRWIQLYLDELEVVSLLRSEVCVDYPDDHPLSDTRKTSRELGLIAAHAASAISDVENGLSARRPELYELGESLAWSVSVGAIPLALTKYHDQPLVEIFQACCESLGFDPPVNCLRYLVSRQFNVVQ